MEGKVCLVTGASRGIGKGIATQLAMEGATVYITGRNMEALTECAKDIKNKGGNHVIPVKVDHSKEDQVESLFQKIKEVHKRLDILVNNAYAAVNYIMENLGTPFWEKDPAYSWDIVNNVGLRNNNYICTVFAARMMVEASGLIVNVSSAGGLSYLFNVPYGVGKAGVDRMSQDTAVELKKHNVAVLTLWPGPVRTELCTDLILENPEFKGLPKDFIDTWGQGETIDFAGKAVLHLARDPKVLAKTGRVLYTVDLGKEYKFREDDGTLPIDLYSIKGVLMMNKQEWLANMVPDWLTIPKPLIYLSSYKF